MTTKKLFISLALSTLIVTGCSDSSPVSNAGSTGTPTTNDTNNTQPSTTANDINNTEPPTTVNDVNNTQPPTTTTPPENNTSTQISGNIGLDANFNQSGVITLAEDKMKIVALDSNDNIFTLSSYSYGSENYLKKHTPAGVIDSSFATDGIFTISEQLDNTYTRSVLTKMIITDTNIFLLGSTLKDAVYIPFVAKLSLSGVLDTSFALNGFAFLIENQVSNVRPASFIIDHLGNFIVAGRIRINANYEVYVAKFNANGVLDTSFNTTGVKIFSKIASDDNLNDTVASVVVDSVNNIYLGGSSEKIYTVVNREFFEPDPFILKLTPTGEIDTSFAVNGKVLVPDPTDDNTGRQYRVDNTIDLLIDQSDSLYLLGQEENQQIKYLLKYDLNGQLDSSFEDNGKLIFNKNNLLDTTYIFAIALDANKNLFLAGTNPTTSPLNIDMFIKKYTADGVLDTSFNTTGTYNYTQAYRSSPIDVAVDSNGRVIVVGSQAEERAPAQGRIWVLNIL